jgi:outer membrane protein OmpA-like peptidoglycan-associated protein
MWAVIGLAGSFRDAECAEVERQPNKIIIRMCSRALFDLDRYALKPEAQQVLSGIKTSLIDQYAQAPLEIEGYTDNLGTAAHNATLSMNRAQSVVEWMQQQGVAAQRIRPVGMGMSKPRFANDTEENRARNRRVEIVLTLEAK